MTTPKWHEQQVLAFDTETTGIDPLEARIVTAAIVYMEPGKRPVATRWLLDPQVDIPAEAASVHGWTNDRLAQVFDTAVGTDRKVACARKTMPGGEQVLVTRADALDAIARHIHAAEQRGAAVVVHNAAYDLTLLDAELDRNLGHRILAHRGVVDPMVIEKAYDPYRKTKDGCRGGKTKCGGCGATDKTLTGLCAHYKVVHAGAHDCADDAIATVRLLHKLVAAWPAMAAWKLDTLHAKQVDWRAEQMNSLRAYFDKNGTPHDGCDPGWPVRARQAVPA